MGKLISFQLLVLFFASQLYALEQCSHLITSGHKELSYYDIASKISSASGEMICPLESNGSLENMHNIFTRDDVIASLVQEDVLLAASRQNPDKLNTLQLGFPIQKEVAHLVVRMDSQIKTIQELGDGVVCVGTPTSGSYFTSLQVKALSNTPWVDAREEFPKCLDLLSRKGVDAVFVLSSAPINLLKGKIGNTLRLIPIPPIHGYESTAITSYGNGKNKIAVDTIAVKTFLLIAEKKVRKPSRISDKLSIGMSSIIEKMDLISQDNVCTNQFNTFGMDISEYQRQACKNGYFGADW